MTSVMSSLTQDICSYSLMILLLLTIKNFSLVHNPNPCLSILSTNVKQMEGSTACAENLLLLLLLIPFVEITGRLFGLFVCFPLYLET